MANCLLAPFVPSSSGSKVITLIHDQAIHRVVASGIRHYKPMGYFLFLSFPCAGLTSIMALSLGGNCIWPHTSLIHNVSGRILGLIWTWRSSSQFTLGCAFPPSGPGGRNIRCITTHNHSTPVPSRTHLLCSTFPQYHRRHFHEKRNRVATRTLMSPLFAMGSLILNGQTPR